MQYVNDLTCCHQKTVYSLSVDRDIAFTESIDWDEEIAVYGHSFDSQMIVPEERNQESSENVSLEDVNLKSVANFNFDSLLSNINP